MKKKDIMVFKHPNAKIYPRPDSLKNKHSGKSVLIIGAGPSSQKIVKHSTQLKKWFDVVVCLNFSIRDFDGIADYLMVLENKPTVLAKWIRENVKDRSLTYIVNQNSVRFFPQSLNLVLADRSTCNDAPDITNYNGSLFDGFSYIREGTSVLIQALHMAGIFGCSEIYMIGVEMMFKDSRYYYDPKRRITHKAPTDRSHKDLKMHEIDFNGEKYQSFPVYYKSAESANVLIKTVFADNGIRVVDFSKGLITEAEKMNIDGFIKRKQCE